MTQPMSIEVTCGICEMSLSVEGVDPYQLEHAWDMFNRDHRHTTDEVHDFQALRAGWAPATDDEGDDE